MSDDLTHRRGFFWRVVRVWSFRAAVIGAAVGAIVSFTFFVMAALTNPPDELSGAGEILLAGVGVAFSGLYVGTSAGVLAGFVHGMSAAWLTVDGRIEIDDRGSYHRAMRRLGTVVILVMLGSLYAMAGLAGLAAGADWLILALGGALAGGMAAFQTPTIVSRYLSDR